MELTNELYDEIDDFLNKRMSTEQEAAFRQRLAQDDDLRQEVATQRLINQGLEAAALNRQLKTLQRGVQRQRLTRRAVTASLVVTMLMGTFYWLYERTQPLMPQEAFEAYYTTAPRDRADAILPPGLAEGRASYYAEQYNLALTQLADLPVDSLRLVPYYRGLTLLMLNRPADAIPNLTTAEQSPDRTTGQLAEWYIALAYLRANNVAQSRAKLAAIRDTPSHPYQALANELLDKLP